MRSIRLHHLLTWLLVSAFCTTGFAQDVTFSTSVSVSKVGVKDRFEVTYSSNKQGDFIAPTYKHFTRVGGVGTGSSSNVNLNTGVTKRTFSYSITLEPKKIGTFTIEGAKIKVGKVTYQSKSVKIQVVKESQARRGRQSLLDQFLGGGASQFQEPVQITEQDMFVRLQTVNSEVYRNQPVLVEYKLYVSKYSCQIEGVDIPTYTDFLSDEIAISQRKTDKETINGIEYEVHTMKKVLLTPQKSGELVASAFKIQARVNTGGFMGTSVIMESNLLTIKVKELPKPFPTNFSNQVGNYSITTVPLPGTIEKDNPLQFKVIVTGKGNLKQLVAPEIKFPEGFESYDPEISAVYANNDSVFEGKVTFSYLLIPRKAGKHTIPKIELTYFDLTTESYKIITTNEVKLSVVNGSGSAGDAEVANSQTEEAMEGDEQSKSLVWFGIIPLILLALGAVFWFVKKKNAQPKSEETEEERRNNARKKLAEKLSVAKTHLDNNEVDEFYNEILLGLNKYVNEKLAIQTSEMTKSSIRKTLNTIGVEEKTIGSFVEVLEQCEMAKYAPLTTQNNQAIYEQSLDVIEEIEGVIR